MTTVSTDQTSNHVTFQLETSQERWQQVLADLPDGHVLQSWPWAEFKARWGWSMRPYLLGAPDGFPRAAAMVLRRRLPGLPLTMLYVPRGPILSRKDDRLPGLVLAQLERLAQRERAAFVKIDPEVVLSQGVESDVLKPSGAQFVATLKARRWRYSEDQVQFRNTVLVDLRLPEEELLGAMKQKTRYNIRLAGRRGIEVRTGTPADFGLIADMYRETAVRDGFAIRPAAYYLDAWQTLHAAGLVEPLVAEFEGRPIAAVILVRSGNRAVYMYGASTGQERQRMPNHLLQWEAIRRAKAQGCHTYDFWGAPDNFNESDRMWGVWRFKAGFNGTVTRHIGAWDYPARPFWYWLFSRARPALLALWQRHSR